MFSFSLVFFKTISIHALREEGDKSTGSNTSGAKIFLSTPSARRATEDLRRVLGGPEISIHALREEGDFAASCCTPSTVHFYPRPPRGGRLPRPAFVPMRVNFYPRPPRGGRRYFRQRMRDLLPISIHALREEGDLSLPLLGDWNLAFLSTPSARRATYTMGDKGELRDISIHALREEGDRR